ncbi:MAG: DUF7544 domain-containing protein [Armatimonadota bacterium]
MDVTKSITPAWEHMVKLLFRPFRLRTWLVLGALSVVTEYFVAFSFWASRLLPGPSALRGDVLGGLLGKAYLCGRLPLMALILLPLVWVGCVAQFVFLDRLVKGNAKLGRLIHLGTSYFVFVVGMEINVFAWAVLGRFPNSLGVLLVFFLLAALLGLSIGREFIIPFMYTRNAGVYVAWREFLPILRRYIWQVILYTIFVETLLLVSALILYPFGTELVREGKEFAVALKAGYWLDATGIVGYAHIVLFVQVCTSLPMLVLHRMLSVVLLGQADESLNLLSMGRKVPHGNGGRFERIYE